MKRLFTPVSLAPLLSFSEDKLSSSEQCAVSAIVIGDQYIGPSCATKFSVRLTNAPVCSHVISTPESMRLHRLCLESTLSTVRTAHISDALVTNKTGSPIHLKDGFALGTYEVLHLSSIEESLPLPVAGMNTQTSDVTDLADVIEPLMPYVNALDYSDAKPGLLKLLAQYRQAIALPGEPLGVKTHVIHHLALQPNTQPTYVPFYRLPHSEEQVVQQKVDELIKEGVIQESHSPWNSPLYLVPKKDESYRPALDFRKVNALTVAYHYLLPVLSELLQSIEKDNKVFTSLDFLSGFRQIPLDKESREITAFSAPACLYR